MALGFRACVGFGATFRAGVGVEVLGVVGSFVAPG